MTDLLSRPLPPPRNWQDFESLTFDLFRRMWRTNDAEMHGRRGQPQAGVDVYGTDRVEGRFTGVQCKGKDADYGGVLNEAELRAEVGKALTFRPPLEVYIVVTTAPNDFAIQAVARAITADHRGLGRFEVRVQGWDTLRQLITDHPELVAKHFRDFAPFDVANAVSSGAMETSQRLDQLMATLQSSSRRIVTEVREGRDGGDAVAAKATELGRLTGDGSPRAALRALTRLLEQEEGTASALARFRILANMGFAHFALGDDDEAYALFRRAHAADPEHPGARAVLAMAMNAEGDPEGAHALSVAALRDDPESLLAAGVMIDTAPAGATVPEMEAAVPEAIRSRLETHLHLAAMARRLDNRAAHRAHAEAALLLAADDWRAQSMVAEALTLPLDDLNDLVVTRTLPDELKMEIDRALDLLRAAWRTLSSRDSSHLGRHVAANLIALLDLAGRNDEADRVLEQAWSVDPDYAPLLRRTVQRAIAADDWRSAWEALGRIPDAERSFDDLAMIAQASLRLDGSNVAGGAVASVAAAADTDEQRELAAGLGVELAAKGEDVQAALAAALAKHPRSLIIRSIGYDQLPEGDPERVRLLDEISDLAAGDMTTRGRVHAAETLFSAGRFSIAADLYAPLHGLDADSFALRRRLRALHEADRRREARALFESLDPALRTTSPYLHLGVAIYERAGLLKAAVRLLEAALDVRDELRDRIIWLQLLLRLGRDEAARRWLRQVPEDIAGLPEELMTLAHLVDRRTCDRKAIEIGYRALRAGYNDPQIHLAYAVGLIINGHAAREAQDPPSIVAPGTGVYLVDTETGDRLQRVIEAGPDPRVEREEISPADDLAIRLVGLSRGDEIEVARAVEGSRAYRVEEIQADWLFAHFRTLRDFQRLFPAFAAFGSIELEEDDSEGRFEPLFQVARRRAEFAREMEGIYRSASFPLPMLSRVAGSSVFELWEGLRSTADRFKVAVGQEAEFLEGRNAIRRAGTLVVDPLSIYAWVCLGVDGQLTREDHRLAVVQSSIDLLRQLLEEREGNLGRRMGTFGWDGEHYRLIEDTREHQERQIELARGAVDLAGRLLLVPAEASTPVPDQVRELLADVHPSFVDTLLASMHECRALLSEDFGFRIVCAEAGARVTWTQPLAQVEQEGGRISPPEYRGIVDALIGGGHDFTMFGNRELVDELREANWQNNERLARYQAVMARTTIDQESLASTLARALIASGPQVTAEDLARFHIGLAQLIDSREPGRAQRVYASTVAAVRFIRAFQLRLAGLPTDLRGSTHLTSPALLSLRYDREALVEAKRIRERLVAGGMSWLS